MKVNLMKWIKNNSLGKMQILYKHQECRLDKRAWIL